MIFNIQYKEIPRNYLLLIFPCSIFKFHLGDCLLPSTGHYHCDYIKHCQQPIYTHQWRQVGMVKLKSLIHKNCQLIVSGTRLHMRSTFYSIRNHYHRVPTRQNRVELDWKICMKLLHHNTFYTYNNDPFPFIFPPFSFHSSFI